MQTDDILKTGDENEAFLGVILEDEPLDVVVDDILPNIEPEDNLSKLHNDENGENEEIYEFFVDDEEDLDKWS